MIRKKWPLGGGGAKEQNFLALKSKIIFGAKEQKNIFWR